MYNLPGLIHDDCHPATTDQRAADSSAFFRHADDLIRIPRGDSLIH